MAHFYTQDDLYIASVFIKGVAFDNDNTLYKEPEGAKEAHEQAALYAVQQQLSDITKPELIKIMEESRKKYGGSLEILEKEQGVNLRSLRRDHYKQLIEITNENGFFNGCSVPKEELKRLQVSQIPSVILTHGNLEWTLYTLGKNGLTDNFNARSIVTKDDVCEGKVSGPAMYIAGLNKLGAPITDDKEERGLGYVMVEDSVKNLKHAKALGMTTVLIAPDLAPEDDVPEYVDVVVKDNHDAIKAVIESNNDHLANIHDASIDLS